MEGKESEGRHWALIVAVITMAVTLIPLLAGAASQGKYGQFIWISHAPQDVFVYLSWMRQAADGHFLQQNLFTTEQNVAYLPNIFFFLLGVISGVLHLPLIFTFQAARLIFGVIFLLALWHFLELIIDDLRCRQVCFLTLITSAGLGWLTQLITTYGFRSVDIWMPESVTFFSLYFSPLFSVSLLLIIGVYIFLLQAERKNSNLYAVYAGLCGLLIGNIHTYDIITLTCIWGVYLITRCIKERKFKWDSWRRALIAGGLSAISTGYLFYQMKTDYVFSKRAFMGTLSYGIETYLLGYGLTFVLALAGLYLLLKPARNSKDRKAEKQQVPEVKPDGLLFLAVWIIVGLAVVYIPVRFQRRLLMGEHIPIAIFAGIFIYHSLRKLNGWKWGGSLLALMLILSLSNWAVLFKDAGKLQMNRRDIDGLTRYYLYKGEIESMNWLRKNAPKNSKVQPLPWLEADKKGVVSVVDDTLANFLPAYTGHSVNMGHWGETPDYGLKKVNWLKFVFPNTPEDKRQLLLKESGVQYIIFSQKNIKRQDEVPLLSAYLFKRPPAYLRHIPEASNQDADVYEVIK